MWQDCWVQNCESDESDELTAEESEGGQTVGWGSESDEEVD